MHQALVLNYSYELPFGSGKRFLSSGKLGNALAGGWKLAAIQRYQSGFPLPIRTANTLPIFNRVLRPNVVAGVSRSNHFTANSFNPTTSRLINSAAFSLPAAYTFGNARPTYSDIRSFSIYAEDLSVVKETHITERISFNLYGSFFNAFNRHRFTGFDTVFSDAAFGMSSGVSEPRLIQIGTRIQF